MNLRSQQSVWWTNISADIATIRASCAVCRQNAPSQQPLPPTQPPVPEHPFQLVRTDYFQLEGHTYLVLVDRYSNWSTIKKCRNESAEDLIQSLREYFCTFGVPKQIASDGGMSYMADSTQQFLHTWGVDHRVSSAYNPHSNLRAETAVKTVKRLISSNTGRSGSLNTDSLVAALLQYRNTPDRDTGLSPAQILFARNLKDALPSNPSSLKLRPEWILTSQAREKALAKRHLATRTNLEQHSKPLPPLNIHDVVQVQNQRGSHANKWDLSGQIVEVLPFDAYTVKMDGSGRTTKRNRQFLRPITPFNKTLQPQPQDNSTFTSNSGPTADRREATTTAPKRLRDIQSSGNIQPTRPDTLTQIQMSDAEFDDGLIRSVRNVQRVHQNMDTPKPKSQGNQPLEPDTQNTITKRVRFPTKRLIEQ